MKKYIKSLVLFVALFLILLSLGNVHAQCVSPSVNPPCDCDGDGNNKTTGGCTFTVPDCDDDADGFDTDADPVNCPGGTDCNDADDGVHSTITCYKDCDGDGFGNATTGSTQCKASCSDFAPKCNGNDWVADNTDCDDGDASVNPGAVEVPCNCKDDDCNATTPDGPDKDGDGYDICSPADICNPDGKLADCNDSDASVNPGAAEVPCNCKDDDCNAGTLDTPPDADGDGYDICDPSDPCDGDANVSDCDDTNGNIYPNAIEQCDGIDNNCPGDPGFGQCDEGCDDDNDDYCDWTMAYIAHALNTCLANYGPGFCGANPDSQCECDKPNDCRDNDANVHPPDMGLENDTSAWPNPNICGGDNTGDGIPDCCDGIDNDCDLTADEGCPMPYPNIRVWERDTGVVVIPSQPAHICIPAGGTKTECYYYIRGDPNFRKEGNFTINVTWMAPVNKSVEKNFTVDHDGDQMSCECFYAADCRGMSCWLWGSVGSDWDKGNPNIEKWCCGDDPDEHYVGGTDGTFACCDNKNTTSMVDLGGDECVIGGVCQDRLVGPDEDGSPALCDGIDNDCDGKVDENCGCDSSKLSCDTNTSCPNFRCNDSHGHSKSCWRVGGDSHPTGATACCGESATFPNTPGEYYIWNPCDGTDACCDQAGECVLRGVCMNYVPQPETNFPCDFIDNDCDCLIDEDYDQDHDGVSTCAGDCNDSNPGIYPGAPEICGDNIDQDCDGEDIECGKPEEIALGNLCRLVYDTLYLLIHAAVAITVLLMVIGGIKLMGAEDPEGASNAKGMIKNAIIGLILVFALAGVGHMFVPECAPLPGTAYHPPSRFGEPPPLSVRILRPQDGEFFEAGENVLYDSLILGGSPPYMYVWDFGDGTPTVYGTCAAAACPCPTAHNYTKGVYTVSVVVTDSAGRKAWDEVEILVDMIIAEIDSPEDGFVGIFGDPIDFNGTVKGGKPPYTYEWTSDKDSPPPMGVAEDLLGYAGLSVNEHVITFTITDSKGRTASDSIFVEILTNVPTISSSFGIDTAQSCWKDTWLEEDQTTFMFNVTPAKSIPAGDNLVIDVRVVEMGDCTGDWIPMVDCCTGDVNSKSMSFAGLILAGTPVEWSFIDFCKKAKKLEIKISTSTDKWTFCACCDVENPSGSCPGRGDPPHDFHQCSVELGPCSVISCD